MEGPTHHQWDETAVVYVARHPSVLLLEESIHINMTPVEERRNRDTELQLPRCWVATLIRQEGKTNRTPTKVSPANPTNSGDGK